MFKQHISTVKIFLKLKWIKIKFKFAGVTCLGCEQLPGNQKGLQEVTGASQEILHQRALEVLVAKSVTFMQASSFNMTVISSCQKRMSA